jgi:hypothetical protein
MANADEQAPERQEAAFQPNKHFRNLKGQMYLEVKYRIVWFREEFPHGQIKTHLVSHTTEGKAGAAVFYAEVFDGQGGSASAHGSETSGDFGDYLEKAETKAVGRALAYMGYGTASAAELDEGERIVDAPVTRGSQPAKDGAPQSKPAAGWGVSGADVRKEQDARAVHAEVTRLLGGDTDAAGKLPKSVDEMTTEELTKTLLWLRGRAQKRA